LPFGCMRGILNGNWIRAVPYRNIQRMSTSTLPKINENNSAFFLCDLQETFRDTIINMSQVIAGAKFLTTCAGVLDIPVIVTEQKPFKPTVQELGDLKKQKNLKLFSKSQFSMLTDPVKESLKEMKAVKNVFLYGVEAHVCIVQTALDLLREGYNVHLVADAVSSQRAADRDFAFQRLDRLGVVLTTAESALYEILGDAKHGKFKECLPHVKEYQTKAARL